MSIGIFTGTIKSIERRHTDEKDFICTVWLTVENLGEQCLRATARNDLAHQMDDLDQGDFITVSGLVDLDSINQPRAKKKILSMPKILQFNQLNQLILVGHAGSDPTVKHTQNRETGDPVVVAKFNLAVNPPRQSDEPNWFSLEFWGRNAEVVEEYVKQGSLIKVAGSVKMEDWQDRQTGDDRAKPVVRVDRLQLISSKRSETDQNNSASTPQPEQVASNLSEQAASTPLPLSDASSSKPEKQTVKRRTSTGSRTPKKSDSSVSESTSQIPT